MNRRVREISEERGERGTEPHQAGNLSRQRAATNGATKKSATFARLAAPRAAEDSSQRRPSAMAAVIFLVVLGILERSFHIRSRWFSSFVVLFATVRAAITSVIISLPEASPLIFKIPAKKSSIVISPSSSCSKRLKSSRGLSIGTCSISNFCLAALISNMPWNSSMSIFPLTLRQALVLLLDLQRVLNDNAHDDIHQAERRYKEVKDEVRHKQGMATHDLANNLHTPRFERHYLEHSVHRPRHSPEHLIAEQERIRAGNPSLRGTGLP